MASDEVPIKEEYGFISVPDAANVQPSYAEIDRAAPDHRRFAIALKGTPVVTS